MKPLHGISKEGLGARVGRSKVWALGAECTRVASKGYTFGDENVYVSQSKRIRFERKTYTFQARNVYVLGRYRICLIRARSLVALVLDE